MSISEPRPAGREAAGSRLGFTWSWCAIAGAGALAVSLVDAALLQRRESYFTGGFLSNDHLGGPVDFAAFAGASLLSDAAVIGLVASAVMWVCQRAGLTVRASFVAGALAGVGPLLIADVISYQLFRYVGDVLDLSLALDLTGGSIAEILAVTSSHLTLPVAAIAGVGGLGGGLVWLVNRHGAGRRAPKPRAGVLVPPAVVCVFALGATVVANQSSSTVANGMLRKPSGRVLAMVGDALTDVDRDGFGLAGRLADPDPMNAAVFPYALEVTGNGLDENGVAGDLPVGLTPYTESEAEGSAWASQVDVLLIVLESFRADLIGSDYRGQPITPVLNELAGRGVSSSHAYSPNGYTSQSRFHLFSGSLAGLRPGTLIDDFKANGYYTAYFSGQDESFGGSRYDIGFSRADYAYDARDDRARRYSTFTTAGSLAVPFNVVQQRVGTFLKDARAPAKPLFMYVNFHDAHFPYSHEGVQPLLSVERLSRGAIAPETREALWSTYVNTAANIDRAVGTLLAEVTEARGRMPGVIVTADHGESLFDDAFLGHGHALNEVQTRVPLVVANLPFEIVEPYTHVDLRSGLQRAMAVAGAKPTRRYEPQRRVFQYLGTLERPRQVAFLRRQGRIIYDFRTDRVQRDGGAWQPPDSLSPPARAEFEELIWHWEQMRLAQARHRDAS